MTMAFHRHTGNAGALLVPRDNNSFERSRKPQQSAAGASDGKRVYKQRWERGGLVCLSNALDGTRLRTRCRGRAAAELLSEEDEVKKEDDASPCSKLCCGSCCREQGDPRAEGSAQQPLGFALPWREVCGFSLLACVL